MFFEQQLLEARGGLTQADEAFKSAQQNSGMLDPASTAKASIESAVAIRAQIAARQVQLSTMRTYSTEQNPQLIRLRQEIAGLQTQLAELTGTSSDVEDDPLVPRDKLPAAGNEYLRRIRDVKYNEAVVAVLSRQFEIARLDEARQGAMVQIVDPAVAADKRSSPLRLVILLACTVFALCFASLWAVYVRTGSRLPAVPPASAAVVMLLLLLASAPGLKAQSLDTPSRPTDCSNNSNDNQANPCSTTQDETAPASSNSAFPDPDTSLDNRPTTHNDNDTERERNNSRRNSDRLADPDEKGVGARRVLSEKPPQPHTEFEQMVSDSAGRPLAVFGHALFTQPPDTFAPAANVQVPADYVIGPGDELHIHIWGQIDADLRLQVDRSGHVYIPKVGEVPVIGLRFGELEETLRHAVERVFKSFSLTVAIERLHSIQVFVMGQAKVPGVYTVSSLEHSHQRHLCIGWSCAAGIVASYPVASQRRPRTGFRFI